MEMISFNEFQEKFMNNLNKNKPYKKSIQQLLDVLHQSMDDNIPADKREVEYKLNIVQEYIYNNYLLDIDFQLYPDYHKEIMAEKNRYLYEPVQGYIHHTIPECNLNEKLSFRLISPRLNPSNIMLFLVFEFKNGVFQKWYLCGWDNIYRSRDIFLTNSELNSCMPSIRTIISLGLNARKKENIKVRQPIKSCKIVTRDKKALNGISSLDINIYEELNVKEVELIDDVEQYVNFNIKPNYKTLGPKLGKKMKEFTTQINNMDQQELYKRLIHERNITFWFSDDSVIVVYTSDFEIQIVPKDGYITAEENNIVIIISTEIDRKLKIENYYREIIRAVQDIRKGMKIKYDDLIEIQFYTINEVLYNTINKFKEKLKSELLAVSIEAAVLSNDAPNEIIDIDDMKLIFKTTKV